MLVLLWNIGWLGFCAIFNMKSFMSGAACSALNVPSFCFSAFLALSASTCPVLTLTIVVPTTLTSVGIGGSSIRFVVPRLSNALWSLLLASAMSWPTSMRGIDTIFLKLSCISCASLPRAICAKYTIMESISSSNLALKRSRLFSNG